MAKLCKKCGGSGWWGSRSALFGKGGPCRACDGSGYDKRLGEKPCKGCSSSIEYRYDWSSVPDYCENCRRDQYKACANPHCNGTVRYKKFWERIPDYCQSCKGWYEKKCENPYCNEVIRVHASWLNIPRFCSCKGWAEKDCSNGCGNKIRFRCDWNDIPEICESCRKNRNNRSDQSSEARNMQRLTQAFPELRDPKMADSFHRYLERHYLRNIDKPTTYEELVQAFFDWKG